MSCPAHDLAASRKMLVQEDVDLIRKLVSKLPHDRDVVVVDLGLGSGTTALSVFAERTEKIHVYSYDNTDEGRWGELAVHNIGQREHFTWIVSKAEEPALGPDSSSVDLLLLDASHTQEGLKREFEAWLPRIRDEGLIWIHDYGDPADFGLAAKKSPGIATVVKQMMKDGILLELEIAGLGWAGRIAEVTEEKE